MTLRLARPLAWTWLVVALVDLAIAGAYLRTGYSVAVLPAILMTVLAIASLWTAVVLATASTNRPVLWSAGWGWARMVLMISGFAVVIGSRL